MSVRTVEGCYRMIRSVRRAEPKVDDDYNHGYDSALEYVLDLLDGVDSCSVEELHKLSKERNGK